MIATVLVFVGTLLVFNILFVIDQVPANRNYVITVFGKPYAVFKPGFHIRFRWTTKAISVLMSDIVITVLSGIDKSDPGNYISAYSFPNKVMVNNWPIGFIKRIRYHVTDPEKYVFNVVNPKYQVALKDDTLFRDYLTIYDNFEQMERIQKVKKLWRYIATMTEIEFDDDENQTTGEPTDRELESSDPFEEYSHWGLEIDASEIVDFELSDELKEYYSKTAKTEEDIKDAKSKQKLARENGKRDKIEAEYKKKVVITGAEAEEESQEIVLRARRKEAKEYTEVFGSGKLAKELMVEEEKWKSVQKTGSNIFVFDGNDDSPVASGVKVAAGTAAVLNQKEKEEKKWIMKRTSKK